MEERRKEIRRRTFKGGSIGFNRPDKGASFVFNRADTGAGSAFNCTAKGASFNCTASIDCCVRNLSPLGACLQVESPVGIPDDFVLVIGSDHAAHPCHVIWRIGTRLGVEFR